MTIFFKHLFSPHIYTDQNNSNACKIQNHISTILSNVLYSVINFRSTGFYNRFLILRLIIYITHTEFYKIFSIVYCYCTKVKLCYFIYSKKFIQQAKCTRSKFLILEMQAYADKIISFRAFPKA